MLLLLLKRFEITFKDSSVSRSEERLKKLLEQRTASSASLKAIQLTLSYLSEYYAIGREQARRSFGLSAVAAVMGFITIIAGIWLVYFDVGNVAMPTLSGAAGVLAEFISVAYFVLYRHALHQLNVFYANLVRLQDIILAANLCEGMKGSAGRDECRAELATWLVRYASVGADAATIAALPEVPQKGETSGPARYDPLERNQQPPAEPVV